MHLHGHERFNMHNDELWELYPSAYKEKTKNKKRGDFAQFFNLHYIHNVYNLLKMLSTYLSICIILTYLFQLN